MSKLLPIILLSLLVQSTSAQKAATYSLKWGSTSRSKVYSTDLLGRDAKGNYVFYAARQRWAPLLFVTLLSKKDYFNVYDEKLNFKESVKMDLPKLKATTFSSEKLLARTALRLGGDAYILQQQEDGGNWALQAWKVDLNKKKLGRPIPIGKIPDGKDIRDAAPNVAVSPDSSKVLVFFPTQNNAKDKEGYYFFVLNRDLSKAWAGRGDIPYDEDDYVKQDVTIDNNGHVTVTGRHFIPKKERKKGDPKWEPVILRYTDKGKPERLELNPSGKFVQRTFLAAGRDGQALAIGFYGNDRVDEQDGIFFAKLGPGGKLEGTRTYEFDNEFLTSTMREDRAKRAKKRMDNDDDTDFSETDFVFKDMVPTADGGFLALGEQYYYFVTSNSNRAGMGVGVGYSNLTFSYNHVYGDIVAAKFTADGSLSWAKKLNHYNTVTTSSPTPPFARQYGFTSKGNRTYLVFEDDERAIDNRDRRSGLGFGRREATVVAEIGEDGSIRRSNVETSEERGGNRLFFPSIFSIENGKVLLASTGGFTGRKKRFGLLTVGVVSQ